MALALALLLPAGLGALYAAEWPRGREAGAADGIAVLTGGARRVETGLALLSAEPAARLIVSGVGRETEWADLARLGGADPALGARVTLGRAAASTRGNAAEIAAWARAERLSRLRVVTADYHMPRAMLELRRALPDAVLLAEPVAVAAPASTVWREAAKYGLARLGLTAVLRRAEAGA